MILTYTKDKNFPKLKEQIFFVDEYGEKFNTCHELRDTLKSTDIFLLSEALGNFSTWRAFVGRWDDLEDYLTHERSEDLEGGYIAIENDGRAFDLTTLNQFLKGA